ncbi:tRNA dihydrouridine synthase DusB [Caloramator proteoclasticus]|uniref:tRNA-dihydrouridine synthase n=1 Tax=Caloramator proteoclasticus DSM 10124 TaxID=1121262 RepID=A0A1M4YP25_9CLOT|nr:tRNA dihydrouridine synthase DusB [Caloramator proteoclasticus]SHF07428.1 tRNA-U20-dihydrouridine synthase [Caloramator proteoclasticus DSM 10124]
MNIGNFVPENNVFLAPMAGVTDKAFRVLCKEYGAGLVYTEMVSSKGLYYGSQRTEFMLDIDSREAPAVVQIFGSDADIMGFMAEKISEKEEVAFIDINMGCPAPKIVKNKEGSYLMKEPELAKRIVKKVVEKSKKPVTVKIRKGWDENSVNAVEFAKMLEDCGVSAIAIHGRTRSQMYEGKADWDIIKKVKESVNIPVIGNGDVVTCQDAKRLLEHTNCDAIMIGRGALGNPWIFKKVVTYLKEGIILDDPNPQEKIELAIRHLEMMYEFKGQRGVIEMRKHIAWYLKGLKNATVIRDMVNRIEAKEEIIKLLESYKGTI